MKKILLIYTGGTIGMIQNPVTGALENFDFDNLLQHVPELRRFDLDILTHILASKQRSVKGKNAYERQAKLIRFALSRGFEMSLIHQCLPDPDEETVFREPDDIDFREPDEDEFHEPDED